MHAHLHMNRCTKKPSHTHCATSYSHTQTSQTWQWYHWTHSVNESHDTHTVCVTTVRADNYMHNVHTEKHQLQNRSLLLLTKYKVIQYPNEKHKSKIEPHTHYSCVNICTQCFYMHISCLYMYVHTVCIMDTRACNLTPMNVFTEYTYMHYYISGVLHLSYRPLHD